MQVYNNDHYYISLRIRTFRNTHVMQEIIMKINWKFEETALQRNIIRALSPLHAERLFEWKVTLQRKHENNYEILSSSKIYTKNWKTQNCERTK